MKPNIKCLNFPIQPLIFILQSNDIISYFILENYCGCAQICSLSTLRSAYFSTFTCWKHWSWPTPTKKPRAISRNTVVVQSILVSLVFIDLDPDLLSTTAVHIKVPSFPTTFTYCTWFWHGRIAKTQTQFLYAANRLDLR